MSLALKRSRLNRVADTPIIPLLLEEIIPKSSAMSLDFACSATIVWPSLLMTCCCKVCILNTVVSSSLSCPFYFEAADN